VDQLQEGSDVSDVETRKFINPTPGWVGCTIINEEGKRQGWPVEPGGFVWLSEAEERLTAEATRLAEDNPFVKTWEEVVGHDAAGDPITETRHGTLVLADAEARPIASTRYTPSQAARDAETGADPSESPAAPETPREDGQEAQEGEQHGADVPTPTGPPPEGKPAPGEVVATPEAVAANDAELKARAEREAEEPTPVTDRPAGTEAIGVPPTREPAPLPV
jgi:hypothetical protein